MGFFDFHQIQQITTNFWSTFGAVMKFVKMLFTALFCLFWAAWAYADPGCLEIIYASRGVNNPLGCPCESTVTHPYSDGVPICVFWDNNANGPDAADVQPEEGEGQNQVSFNCTTLNGQGTGYGRGYFDTDPYFCVGDLPSFPDTALYYLQINSGGCCWRSDVFLVQPGVDEWYMDWANWHCVNTPCGGGEVPSAPANCVASNDLYCLEVLVTWQHNGQNVNGFNIYADDTLVASATAAARSYRMAVYTDRVRSYRVSAYNGAGESAPSNADNGSAYQLRFVLGPSGNLTGRNLHGSQFTVHFERPTPTCYCGAELWLLVNGERHSTLCRDSLVTQLTCRLPDDTTLNNCRLLLVDSSFIYPWVVLTDTTDSVFHLGIPSTSVGDAMQLLPDHFELAQNFPNPFNPETEIMFSVPNPTNVRIRIYNIMGQQVRTLTDAHYAMGVHRITWDGRSDAGLAAGAGVYIYRMEAPGFVQTRKMLLMK
jgi:hypothetical protein